MTKWKCISSSLGIVCWAFVWEIRALRSRSSKRMSCEASAELRWIQQVFKVWIIPQWILHHPWKGKRSSQALHYLRKIWHALWNWTGLGHYVSDTRHLKDRIHQTLQLPYLTTQIQVMKDKHRQKKLASLHSENCGPHQNHKNHIGNGWFNNPSHQPSVESPYLLAGLFFDDFLVLQRWRCH